MNTCESPVGPVSDHPGDKLTPLAHLGPSNWLDRCKQESQRVRLPVIGYQGFSKAGFQGHGDWGLERVEDHFIISDNEAEE